MTAPLAATWRPAADRSDERIVFVHGFTQTRRSWDRWADALSDHSHTVAVDAPGHGESGDLRLDFPTAAEALGATGGRATYVGYSMGGRLALQLAVTSPNVVDRLVLVSSTAGIADDAERATRRAADEQRADEIERDGVAAFLDRWLAQPLFANLPSDRADLAYRLTNTAAGLASSLRLAGTGAQPSLWPRLSGLPMPVLVVAGEVDPKFVAIAERMAALIPDAELAVLPHAGHAVHLQRPDEFERLLRDWLDG